MGGPRSAPLGAGRVGAVVVPPGKPAPGEHELCVRAHDETGRSQPVAPPWNVGGYANNAVQRVAVTVA